MEYINYYKENYFRDLQIFRKQIPIEGNKHYEEDTFKIQYFQLTPSYNYLDFLKSELAEFVVSLFFSVLFDQVAYNLLVSKEGYKSFRNATNYPKFIGNCTSVSGKFSQCGQNQHPIYILQAINDFEDQGNSFEFDKLPFKSGEKHPKRIVTQYSDTYYKASIFFEQESKAFFCNNDFGITWIKFWTLVDINLNRKELLELLRKY